MNNSIVVVLVPNVWPFRTNRFLYQFTGLTRLGSSQLLLSPASQCHRRFWPRYRDTILADAERWLSWIILFRHIEQWTFVGHELSIEASGMRLFNDGDRSWIISRGNRTPKEKQTMKLIFVKFSVNLTKRQQGRLFKEWSVKEQHLTIVTAQSFSKSQNVWGTNAGGKQIRNLSTNKSLPDVHSLSTGILPNCRRFAHGLRKTPKRFYIIF